MHFLANLDRRWIFLLMAISVAVPIFLGITFEERPTKLTQNVFDAIEDLPEGSPVLLAFDFDPASEGELGPMATTLVRHCCEKQHKIVFLALWPLGPQMIEEEIDRVIKADFPEMIYGRDYVNLGYKSGGEAVIKVIVTDLRSLFPNDVTGTSLDALPILEPIRSVRDFDLIANVSAGSPGTKEWIQYAGTIYPDEFVIVSGCTGVQAPLFYPYIPNQLFGLLAAIKGAAEYEQLVLDKYAPKKQNDAGEEVADPAPKYLEAKRRMAPQLSAHVLMVAIIILGNVVYFWQRSRGLAR